MSSVTRKTASGRSRRGVAEAEVFRALDDLLARGSRFTELGVQQIAEEAGIGRSTFYVHFADKTDLLIRYAENSTRELFAVAANWVESEHVEVLEATLLGVIRQRRAHAPALRALSEVASYDPDVERAWATMVSSNIALVRERIQRDQQSGLVAADVDAELTASYLTWGVERSVGRHVDAGCGARDEDMARTLARSIWLTLYGRL